MNGDDDRPEVGSVYEPPTLPVDDVQLPAEGVEVDVDLEGNREPVDPPGAVTEVPHVDVSPEVVEDPDDTAEMTIPDAEPHAVETYPGDGRQDGPDRSDEGDTDTALDDASGDW